MTIFVGTMAPECVYGCICQIKGVGQAVLCCTCSLNHVTLEGDKQAVCRANGEARLWPDNTAECNRISPHWSEVHSPIYLLQIVAFFSLSFFTQTTTIWLLTK